VDTDAYVATLLARFRNAGLPHALAQIAQDGSEKLPQRLGPVIAACLEQGRSCQAAMLGIAAWLAWLNRAPGQVVDPRAEALRTLVRQAGGDVDVQTRSALALEPFDPVPVLRRDEVVATIAAGARRLTAGLAPQDS
jgi:fructuronate reductase